MKVGVLFFAICLFSLPSGAQQSSQPISLHPRDPHYFLYQGKAIALVGSGEHYGSVINPDFDFHKYLSTLQADGLNYTRIFSGSYIEVPAKSFGIQRNTLAPLPGRFLAPWARSNQPGFAAGGNKFDLDRWNPDYFQRLHAFLSEAVERGIVVEISLFTSQYGEPQWEVSPFHAANNVNHTTPVDLKHVNTRDNGNLLAYQERYVRKLVDETAPFPNVIYEIQNEPWADHGVMTRVENPYLAPPGRDQFPNSIDVADQASLNWQSLVAQWIASEESSRPSRHMIAQNFANFGLPVRDVVPGVSILNFHYAYPESVTLNYGLNKAISYDETGFLGNSDGVYRRQAWNFMLAGGGTFDHLDYSFTLGHEDGTDTEPNGPGGGSPAFRRQLRILKDFLAGLPLVDLAPDPHTVVHAAGSVPHALSSRNGVYAIYLDGDGPSRLTLKLPVGSYRGEWLDVVTGARTSLKPFKSDGSEQTLDTPAFTNGIALRLARTLSK